MTDAIKVEATLEGGKRASATLEPGATKAELVEPKKPVVAPAVTTTTKPDLQGNPYGAP